MHAAGDRGSIKNTATIVAVSSIPFMFTIPAFYIEKRSRPIPINIRRNQTERERLLNSYQDLTNKWEKELELKNSKVREANSEIEEYNRKLPPASVTYK